ncbi:hypothetical protein Asppvi_005296 [Aspergillus pseudoviridinutans]|uniref:Serine hydrolase domain-containing protein n=1 Tax=Aspergillus pseudoviridinutans TaxID=1517512 RepID=A0A9P3EUU0_9EURO|nr:uncharacterized protein Asppvi_005296 [Aspergillus pseudoviridinutans]GIJ86408.1 hypothetical protein Asppvi_005296 [Aspergillus pseudoviridinutans]
MITITSESSPKTNEPTVHSDPGLHLPRILCLHGGGTNARIFRAQCRSLSLRLEGRFRLIFADAPFLSGPGPDVESVYAEWGPFRSWVRPTAGGAMSVTWAPGSVDVEAVDTAISNAVLADDKFGATGSIVGLLGFSQGARMAACLLLRRQQENARRNRPNNHTITNTEYRFAVLLAGRGPLVALDNARKDVVDGVPPSLQLRLPTIHVHGTRDPGLAIHRELLHRDCVRDTARVIEWDGGHRVPIKTKDVAPVVDAILQTARETGII